MKNASWRDPRGVGVRRLPPPQGGERFPGGDRNGGGLLWLGDGPKAGKLQGFDQTDHRPHDRAGERLRRRRGKRPPRKESSLVPPSFQAGDLCGPRRGQGLTANRRDVVPQRWQSGNGGVDPRQRRFSLRPLGQGGLVGFRAFGLGQLKPALGA